MRFIPICEKNFEEKMRIVFAKIGNHKTVNFALDELCRYIKMIDSDTMVDRRTYPAYGPSLKGVIWIGVDSFF